MEQARRSWFWGHCGTDRDRMNQRRMVISGMAWMGTWLALIYVIGRDWLSAFAATAASVVPLALGVGMIIAYRRYLGETDELRRKIEVDALALAFGVGLVGAFSYVLLERAGAVARADPMQLVMLMVATYVIGVVLGHRRYG